MNSLDCLEHIEHQTQFEMTLGSSQRVRNPVDLRSKNVMHVGNYASVPIHL